MTMSIVYLAQCTTDRSKLYVGKTDRSLDARMEEHEKAATGGSPSKFQQELLLEGLKHWDWRELEQCSPEPVHERERFWIQELKAFSMDLLNTAHTRKRPSAL